MMSGTPGADRDRHRRSELEPDHRSPRDVVVPVHGQCFSRGHDRRGAGCGDRAFHGVAPAELRRPYPVADRFPGCGRGGPDRCGGRLRLLRFLSSRSCGHRDVAAHRAWRLLRGVGGHRNRAGLRAGLRFPVRRPVQGVPQQHQRAAVRQFSGHHHGAGHHPGHRRRGCAVDTGGDRPPAGLRLDRS